MPPSRQNTFSMGLSMLMSQATTGKRLLSTGTRQRKQPKSPTVETALLLIFLPGWTLVCLVSLLMTMVDLVIAGCTTSSVTLLAPVALGQKADQSKKTEYRMSGRKETTLETTNERAEFDVLAVNHDGSTFIWKKYQ